MPPASSPGSMDGPSSSSRPRTTIRDRAARIRYRRALMLMAMTIAMPIIGGGDISGTNFSVFDLFALVVASILVTLFIVQTSATARMLRRRGN